MSLRDARRLCARKGHVRMAITLLPAMGSARYVCARCRIPL